MELLVGLPREGEVLGAPPPPWSQRCGEAEPRVAVSCWPVSSSSKPLPCSGRLLSTITEPTSAALCDPPLVEETSSSPPVSEESEVDRTDHGGIKKVCFKVSEDEQEDSGHDTMSYRDSYRCV